MKILAMDIGKFKTVACDYDSQTGEHHFTTLRTAAGPVHDLLARHQPKRMVIEIGNQAGWIHDLAEAMSIEVQVANPNHEGWRWHNVKRKTDRDDALKLAQLSTMNQLPLVHMPSPHVRQWRELIAYRHTLVARRTAIKNSIRSILDRQGLSMPGGKSGWTKQSVAAVATQATPMAEVEMDELWRGQLHSELEALKDIERRIEPIEARLDKLAGQDERVERVRSIPGVGPRLAELVVAVLDDPHRFNNGKQVGAYAGLIPSQYQSGEMERQGRTTKRGNKLLRALLVEVSWLMRQHNAHFSAIFDRVCHGSKTRRKIAIVAVARKLLVTCWAMLRDATRWRDPAATARSAIPT